MSDDRTENERLRWGIEDALRMLDSAHDGSVILPLREHLRGLLPVSDFACVTCGHVWRDSLNGKPCPVCCIPALASKTMPKGGGE